MIRNILILVGALLAGRLTAADPVNAQDAVNLRTAQALMSGVGASKRARVLATANVALTGVQNFDGQTGVASDIVWLNGQTTTSQNGLVA